jgi:uncharacterized protein (TIGR03118 family)
MKISRLALIIPFVAAMACSSNNNTSIDARDAEVLDGSKIDHPSTDGIVSDVAEPVDTASDVPVTPVDGPAPDAGAPDAAAPDVAIVDAGVNPQKIVQTVLVVDQLPDAGVGNGPDGPLMPTVDPNLVNPWGVAFNPTGPLWVADNGTGLSTVYGPQGQILPVVVTIPPATGGTPPSAPSGLVFNPTSSFLGDKFIFSSENGTIAGWQTGTTAVTRADNATAHTVYKGLALGLRDNVPRLYATDFHNGKVDAYDLAYNKITTSGGFADATIPAGFAPFGIQAEGAIIFVTYAKQDALAMDDVKGVGNGFVDMFDFDGVLTKRMISGGALNSPWGIAFAPSDFGTLSHLMLVGNFGDGHINAYDPTSGAFSSSLIGTTGGLLVIPGLWGLTFGNDTAGAAHNQLFFTAGPDDEMHGVLGRLDFVP